MLTLKARLEGPSLMGWDGMDGTEYQTCPLIFFILCGYIEKVYTYLYVYLRMDGWDRMGPVRSVGIFTSVHAQTATPGLLIAQPEPESPGCPSNWADF